MDLCTERKCKLFGEVHQRPEPPHADVRISRTTMPHIHSNTKPTNLFPSDQDIRAATFFVRWLIQKEKMMKTEKHNQAREPGFELGALFHIQRSISA